MSSAGVQQSSAVFSRLMGFNENNIPIPPPETPPPPPEIPPPTINLSALPSTTSPTTLPLTSIPEEPPGYDIFHKAVVCVVNKILGPIPLRNINGILDYITVAFQDILHKHRSNTNYDFSNFFNDFENPMNTAIGAMIESNNYRKAVREEDIRTLVTMIIDRVLGVEGSMNTHMSELSSSDPDNVVLGLLQSMRTYWEFLKRTNIHEINTASAGGGKRRKRNTVRSRRQRKNRKNTRRRRD